MAEISETALRAQLNARFRRVAADRGWLVDDVQREFALQQFVGRVFRSDVADDWVLTGGSALRIRTTEARPTGDADLATRGDILRVTESLTGALQSRLGEPGEFVFTIRPTRSPGQYAGVFEYRLAGKRFANGAIDISTDRPVTYEPDLLRPTPVVDLAALTELPYARVYPVELHLADKVAAMYQKFGPDGATPSTRTHDLADIVILSRTAVVEAAELRAAIAQQEQRRGITIPVPLVLPNPSWRSAYPIRLRHSGLPTELHDVDNALAAANNFLTPILRPIATTDPRVWDPATARWVESAVVDRLPASAEGRGIGELLTRTTAVGRPDAAARQPVDPSEAAPTEPHQSRGHDYGI